MDRRSFLLAAGAGAGAALAGGAYWRWQEIEPVVHANGRAEGHFLRDRRALPPPSRELDTGVLILGSGIAALTAAWKLNKEGRKDFLMIEGPERYGNAAGGAHGDLAFPTGAHYLPLPPPEAFHVREILHDVGIIQRNPHARRPYYDERYILHAPQERVLYEGRWQEGTLPSEGVPQWELDEHRRFAAEVERLRELHGSDGRRLFVLPVVHSSADPAWRALDRLSFKQWLAQQGYRSPTLHWYLDYCCRDDYGAGYERTSAWAGLHYCCSRGGEAENAGAGEWLTWPGGLHPLAEAMDKASGRRRMAGTAVSLSRTAHGVRAHCFEIVGGRPRSYAVNARKAVCAMPLFVAARVVEGIADYGFDPRRDLPAYAPWMVTNFLMKRFPRERPEAPLSWDNVAYRGPGLGYVVSTHQDIRVTPPPKTVFTAYLALSDRSPEQARRWLDGAAPEELLAAASADLRMAYGPDFKRCVERADITLRAHAMATPGVGFLGNRGLQALRELDGPILFAHSDLSGLSLFEEAAWWGYQAALKALA